MSDLSVFVVRQSEQMETRSFEKVLYATDLQINNYIILPYLQHKLFNSETPRFRGWIK
jgi:hypothetical protein